MKSVVFAICLMFPPITVQAAAEPSDAQRLVKSTAEQVTERIRADREALRKDRGRLYGLVNELIIPHFDFKRISRWVLGKHWRTATDKQKQAFSSEFQKLLVRTYATVLLEYVDQEISYFPVRPTSSADRVTVRTEITQPGGGPPIPIIYRMHSRDDGWKVYDISVDGVSLLSTYRSSFSSDIRKYGLDGLISRLQSKRGEYENRALDASKGK